MDQCHADSFSRILGIVARMMEASQFFCEETDWELEDLVSNDARYVCALKCTKQSPPSYFVLRRIEPKRECTGQLGWSTDRWPLTVLCDGCSQLSVYSEQDIRKVSVDSMDPDQLLPKRIWSIEVRCDQQNCGVLTKIVFRTGIGAVKESAFGTIRDWRVRCPKCAQPIELNSQFEKSVTLVTEVYT
jgi:hypothetical protein